LPTAVWPRWPRGRVVGVSCRAPAGSATRWCPHGVRRACIEPPLPQARACTSARSSNRAMGPRGGGWKPRTVLAVPTHAQVLDTLAKAPPDGDRDVSEDLKNLFRATQVHCAARRRRPAAAAAPPLVFSPQKSERRRVSGRFVASRIVVQAPISLPARMLNLDLQHTCLFVAAFAAFSAGVRAHDAICFGVRRLGTKARAGRHARAVLPGDGHAVLARPRRRSPTSSPVHNRVICLLPRLSSPSPPPPAPPPSPLPPASPSPCAFRCAPSHAASERVQMAALRGACARRPRARVPVRAVG
jgi:hypothetical protein